MCCKKFRDHKTSALENHMFRPVEMFLNILWFKDKLMSNADGLINIIMKVSFTCCGMNVKNSKTRGLRQ